MQALCPRPNEHAAIRTDLKAIFVSLELSRSTWVITSLAPGGGEKMSKHAVPSGDIAALLARLSQLGAGPCTGTGLRDRQVRGLQHRWKKGAEPQREMIGPKASLRRCPS